MSTFLDRIKQRAKADKKTIVLPESMDRRTWEAAETVLKEDIANIIAELNRYNEKHKKGTINRIKLYKMKMPSDNSYNLTSEEVYY